MTESDPASDDYHQIAAHYERCLRQHGPNHRGVDWPNAVDLETRFAVMLAPELPVLERPELLDIGCGPGLLLDYLEGKKQRSHYRYRGVDLSGVMVDAARQRWPQQEFEVRDILLTPLPPLSADLVIMNGVLTEKASLTQSAMVNFARQLIKAAFSLARHALAFNVMSVHVDWQRDQLFHWPFDEMAAFLRSEVSRHVVIRADYGLYEYTVYVYRQPNRS